MRGVLCDLKALLLFRAKWWSRSETGLYETTPPGIVQIPCVYLTNPSDGNPETPDATGYMYDQTQRKPPPIRMAADDE